VLQDFPQSTNVFISPAVIRRVVESDPSCVMLKHEDWPGLPKISALREAGLLAPMAGGNVIRLLPPLNATTEELARSVEIFRAVLKAKA
jgi:hypothetical protein